MSKGSGTRSGLLWEVERLLNECEELPQILFMENVPQVHNKKNMEDFQEWLDYLTSLGYTNYYKDLCASDYGVAQHRKRCFMFSFLGNYTYKFPEPFTLTKKLKDYLEDNVDEKYYINNEKAYILIQSLIDRGILEDKNRYMPIIVDSTINSPNEKEIANCIKARYDNGISNFKSEIDIVGKLPTGGQRGKVYNIEKIIGTLTATEYKDHSKILVHQLGNISNNQASTNFKNPQCGRVYDSQGCSPTLNTCGGGNHQPKVIVEDSMIVAMRGRNPYNPSDRTVGNYTEQRLEPNTLGICNTLTTVQKDNLVLEKSQYRIRKLTPREYGRLMGVSDEDITKMMEVNSNSQLYKQFGNSIVVDMMYWCFRNLFET